MYRIALTLGKEPATISWLSLGDGGLEILRIRLRRVGAKKHPSYRIVVADSRAPRDGKFVDQIGHYDPMTDPPTINMDEEKALKWLRNGAQPSEPVARMLKKLGTLERVKES